MFDLIKLVGVSAVLSAGLVTASEMQPQPEAQPISGKIYIDRVPEGEPAQVTRAVYTAGHQDDGQGLAIPRHGKGNALLMAPQAGCASQAWPHITPECLAGSGSPARGSVRMITVEQRQGADTSVLVRVPTTELARY